MDNYKQALDKAVEYIMSEYDHCAICVNFDTCQKQFAVLDAQGIEYHLDKSICKDSVRQYFIKQAEADNKNDG